MGVRVACKHAAFAWHCRYTKYGHMTEDGVHPLHVKPPHNNVPYYFLRVRGRVTNFPTTSK